MRTLLAFAESEAFRNLVQQTTRFSSVQGIILDYDPLWLDCWRLKSVQGEEVLDRIVEWEYFSGPGFLRWQHLMGQAELQGVGSEMPPPDAKWLPKHWDFLQRSRGRRADQGPITAKVCLYSDSVEELSLNVEEYPFPVQLERRQAATLSMPLRMHRPIVGGVSVGTGPSHHGTLGGILEDQKGRRWGVTCEHVLDPSLSVEQPAVCDSSSASKIGTTQYVSGLRASTANAPCNPYDPVSVMNDIDAALIELSPGVSADLQILQQGRLAGISAKASLYPGQLVEMSGKTSGLRVLEVGGLGPTYRLHKDDGTFYCFHHVFELRWPRWWYCIGGRPVQAGDSGAWLTASGGAGKKWAGMAVAGDRLLGYAMFADNVVSWASNKEGLQLKVT